MHPTFPSFVRRNSALVRYGPYAGEHHGKPRFEYDPRNMPIGLYEMLTAEEQAVVEQARAVLMLPADSNVSDVRQLLPDAFTGSVRAALVALQTTFPHPDEVAGAIPA